MILAGWPGGSWEATAQLVAVVGGAYIALLWLSATVWAYRDIRSRTHDQFTHFVAIALILVFNLPGLLLYLVLRPGLTMKEAYERQLDSEALLREVEDQPVCSGCKRLVRDDYIVCPHCRTPLREACPSCGKLVSLNWQVCAYCGAERRVPSAFAATAQKTASRRASPRPVVSIGDSPGRASGDSPASEPAPTPATAETEGV